MTSSELRVVIGKPEKYVKKPVPAMLLVGISITGFEAIFILGRGVESKVIAKVIRGCQRSICIILFCLT